jgi:hypothetical protein
MKVLEMERLSTYKRLVKGTWRQGSYTEDSVRHAVESAGNGAFHL